MKERSLFISYAVVLIVQIVLNVFLNLSQYVVISFLPAMIVCLPTRYKTFLVLPLAFAAGFAADLFAGGTVGLSACALLPVAFTRKAMLNVFFGKEYFSRREDIASDTHGYVRTNMCFAFELLLFLLIYVTVDGAGMRPAGFNALRILVSFVVNLAASQVVLLIFASSESSARWR